MTEVGAGVARFAVGDRVVAVARGGAFASEACVPASACFRLPPSLPPSLLPDAAGLAVAAGTADVALRRYGRLTKNDVVCVTGAGGGVGTAAVQLAAAAGATVVAVARGAAKAAALKGLGAGAVVDPSTLAAAPAALRDAVLAATGGKRVTILLDTVGGGTFDECFRAVAWGGRVLVVGFASGTIPRPPLNLLLVKNVSVHGVFWGSHMEHAPRVVAESMARLVDAFASGALTVPVSHRLPLTAWPAAVAAMAGRSVVGKVLLVPGAAGAAARL